MRIILLVLLSIFGGSACAQSVSIRSGDHANFSRLVLTVGDQSGWQLEGSETGFVLTKPEFDRSFNADQVFNRIQRNRIGSVQQNENGQLEIAINCECHGDLFPYGNSQIVVDVIDGAAPPDWQGPNYSKQTVVPAPTPVIAKEERQIDLPIFFVESRSEDKAEKPNAVPLVLNTPAPLAQEMRSQLLGQIANAAAQGLLAPNLTTDTKTEKASVKTAKPETVEEQPTSVAPVSIVSNLGLRATSSFDELAELLSPSISRTTDMMCNPDFDYDFSKWIFGEDFADGLSSIRYGQAKSELRQPDQDTRKIAQHYLYYAFGVEALATLRGGATDTAEFSYLARLARFFDAPNAPQGTGFSEFSECSGILGLLAFLTESKANTSSKTTPQELAQIMQSLPLHLQTHLGPVWVKKLEQRGLTELAVAATRVVEKLSVQPPVELTMQTAQRALANDDVEEASRQFETVAASNDNLAVSAFLETLDILIQQGGIPTPEQTTLIDSYLREYLGTEIEPRLSRMAAFVRVMSGDVADGLDRYSSLNLEKTELEADLAEILEISNPQTILSLAQQVTQSETGFKDADLTPLAEKVEKFGFIELARQIANAPLNQPSSLNTQEPQPNTDANSLVAVESNTQQRPQPVEEASLEKLGQDLQSARELREAFEESLSNTQLEAPSS